MSVVVRRIQSLPEYGRNRPDDAFDESMKRLAAAIEACNAARQECRLEAKRIYEKARRNWTAEEIQAATGY